MAKGRHYEGEPAKVKGTKKGEEWVWHCQTYRTDSGIKRFWTTILKKVPIIGSAIVSSADAYSRWQDENDK